MALPQREGAASLDIAPDATPVTAGWDESYNDPMNDRNKPVPLRKGGPAPNGWVDELYDTNQDDSV
jgi:hypothetical protein